ncbi:glycosyltransferase [Candidatus Albibeggiatoa sp. nov. NOAA]|uniref:glycosyltransferase n=1 Tax=Candidatus Albibeggiatoa sp. nov. NOAA TaxID=3162724 RepID=UPI0032F652FB|nr:glycosyltransferase [Thiotrichaceae bacterium]
MKTHQAKIYRHRQVTPAPTIGIVIRTKDRPHLLKRSLVSLAEQKRIPDEVVIVNDGGESVADYVNEFTTLKIRLIDNEVNQGRSRSGNLGVDACQSDYIGFLDDDDRYLPDHLQRLEKAIAHFDAKVTYSGCRLLQRDMLGDKVILQEEPIGQYNDPFDANRLQYENYIPLINLLIKRDLWNELQGFDENFEIFEDWDILLRLSQLTRFYHVNKITAEYAVWGNEQITRASTSIRWERAYRRFLKKHVLQLSEEKELDLLARYWMVSQERRGITQDRDTEIRELQRDLLRKQQQYDQLRHDSEHAQSLLAEKQDQYNNLQHALDQAQATATQQGKDAEQRYIELQQQQRKQIDQQEARYIDLQQQQQKQIAEYEERHTETRKGLQKQVDTYEKQATELAEEKRKLQKRYDKLERHYAELEKDFQTYQHGQQQSYDELEALSIQFQQRANDAEQALSELSKQLQVGFNREVTYLPMSYHLANDTGGILDDFNRVLDWTRNKVDKAHDLENHVRHRQHAALDHFQGLKHQIRNLAELMGQSRWWQVRRYISSLDQIEEQLDHMLAQTHAQFDEPQHFVEQLDLTHLEPQLPEQALPPSRPISTLYPIYTTVSGDDEQSDVMETVTHLGDTPFLFNTSDDALIFTTHSTLDNFYRIDLMCGTRLRANACHLRVIIRDLDTKVVLRVETFNMMNARDNSFYPLRFEPIADSAGKTYQVEIDSPNARPDAGIAVWCLHKPSRLPSAQQVPDHIAQRSPETLPAWVQQSILSMPLTGLNTDNPSHLFIVRNIQWDTPLIRIQSYLLRLSEMLQQADTDAQVVLCGDPHWDVRHYYENLSLTYMPETDLRSMLDYGQQYTQADYVWLCDLEAQPQADAMTQFLEVIEQESDVGVVVPMETYGIHIRAAYATALRDGVLYPSPVNAPANHFYHGYRREVNGTTSDLLIFKQDALTKIELAVLPAYHLATYQLSDLMWQLKEQGLKSIYESSIRLVHHAARPNPEQHLYEQDCTYFYNRWRDGLPTALSLNSHMNEMVNPEAKPTVLVIDATLPTYDEDSGSLRMYTTLKIWNEMGFRITFYPDNMDGNFKYRHALEALGIEVAYEYNIQDVLSYRRFDYAMVCRVDVGQRYIPHIRMVSPTTQVFYDTVDIHYVREERQAEIENNPKLAKNAVKTKQKELSNCLLSDRVLVVTDADGKHLQQEIPNLDYAVLPNVHTQQPLSQAGFDDRDGLVFIGNYNHQPNEDAVYYFVEKVLPKVHEQLPDVKFYVVGSNMKDDMKELASEHVKIVGWVDEVAPEFEKRRVFVSYLRYGAGMKGKIGQALSLGLPVVCTRISAEGMGLVDEETALLADDAEGFAQQICRLYQDKALWEQLAKEGYDYIERTYGETAMREKLEQLTR